jgi:RNA polymerase sigma factor (sigma-70 family)
MVKEEKHPKAKRSYLSVISRVFLENNTFLKRYLARFLREQQDIEDVVQEAYLRAYNVEQKKTIDEPKAFLFQIAKNLALSELNRKARQVTDYIDDVDSSMVVGSSATTEQELEARQHIALFCEAVASLPERRRRVCLMRKVHGLPHKEISERLGITVSAVEKHLLKGMLACRAYIREKEQGRLMANAATLSQSGSVEGRG